MNLKELFETSSDVQIISTKREYPDAPIDLILRIKDQYYSYKNVGYDDLETFRWMVRKGAGFKALNWFKKKGYEYQRIKR